MRCRGMVTKQSTGCLIVEIHNHKTTTNSKESPQNSSAGEKSEPISIHNTNPYLTPSPWVPYPKDQLAGPSKPSSASDNSVGDEEKGKTAQQKDKENMPAPGQHSKGVAGKAKIMTVVLHPTQLAQYIDIAIKATTPAEGSNKRRESSQYEAPLSANGARPQTPMLTIPSAPNTGMDPPPAKRIKREKMELDVTNVYSVESQITLATCAPLFLEPTRDARDTIALLDALSHPDHSEPMPSPMMRKKTVAELEAEDSAAKIEEKYMLAGDERYSAAAGGAAGADVDGPVGGASFEPRFEKFKAIEGIKVQVAENKKREKILQAEAAKKQQLEAEAKEKTKQEEAKRLAEEAKMVQLRQAQQQHAQNARAQQTMLARQMQLQQQQKALQAANAHGHPQGNMAGQNAAGMNPQQARFMQQNQIAQTQASSPVPRNSTPQNMSSPMVGQNMGIPMQTSTSSMGGSPPRPGSVVPQGAQMSPQMAQAMRAQSSQQSHGGTPRMANGTPSMPHQMPMANQTPRMTQPSPRPGQMGQAQLGNMLANQNLDPHVRQQIMQQQQQQQQVAQQRMRMAAAAQAMGANPGQAGMTPQQQMALQQQMAQQQLQGGNTAMGQNPLGAQYAAQMRMMQAQHAAQAAAQGQNVPQNGMNLNMGMGGGAFTPQMIQQANQRAMNQAQQGQMAQPTPQMVQQMKVRQMTQQIFQAQLPAVSAQYPNGIPDLAKQQLLQQSQQQAVQRLRQMMQQQAMRQQQQQAMMGAQGQMGMNMGMNMGMQQGSPQQGQMGMNGMQMGGMQRPPGM